MVWRFVVHEPAGGPQIGELTDASDRKLTVPLDAAGEVSCTIPGGSDQARLIAELATDLVVYRDGDRLFRGRIGATTDTVTDDDHRVTVAALDYRALLDRRILHTALTFTQDDQEAIGWDLIAYTQALPGGNLGITRGAAQTTGVLRDRTYEPGKPVGEALAQLGQVIGGFDWHIDENLVYRAHHPRRGTDTGYTLDYGGTVTQLTRRVDPGAYANAVRLTGDDTTTPVVRTAADIATDPTGRFDAAEALVDVSVQATLAERADRLLADRDRLLPHYTVTLRPGVWRGRADLWAGDDTLVAVRTGRLDERVAARAELIDISVDDDGGETVQITAAAGHSFRRRLYDLDRRIGALERTAS